MLQYIKEASPFTWQTSMPACSTAGQIPPSSEGQQHFCILKSLPLINVHNCSAVQNKAVIPTKEGYAEPGCLLAIQQKHTNYQSPHLRFTNTLQSHSNPFYF
jgi:hypothetical protein